MSSVVNFLSQFFFEKRKKNHEKVKEIDKKKEEICEQLDDLRRKIIYAHQAPINNAHAAFIQFLKSPLEKLETLLPPFRRILLKNKRRNTLESEEEKLKKKLTDIREEIQKWGPPTQKTYKKHPKEPFLDEIKKMCKDFDLKISKIR